MECAEGRREFEKFLLSRFVESASRALDFDEDEWQTILSTYAGSLSMRLQIFGDPCRAIGGGSIATAVHDANPGPQGAALASKIAALPAPVQLAVMDIVDRFWVEKHESSAMSEILEKLGVRITKSAHAKLDAAAVRAELDL